MAEDNYDDLATLNGQTTPLTSQLVGEDIFDGIPVPELLEWRKFAQHELIFGAVQSSSAGDTTATSFSKLRPEARIRMINKTLWLRDPVTFPMNQPVKRTRPVYVYG